ncbi:MAG: hypothetical protein ACK5LN_01065 [Propioniciclava sp.]
MLLATVLVALTLTACVPAIPGSAVLAHQVPTGTDFSRRVSISPFPYDLTPAAVREVGSLVSQAGNVYTVQLDNGIPWQDADTGADFSAEVMEEWERHRGTIGTDQEVYLAIAPLQDDRSSWATGFDGTAAPPWATWEQGDLDRLRTAYLNYVERAVAYFEPTLVNIGVEAGDLAHNDPGRWDAAAAVLADTHRQLKLGHPDLQIGISWSLPLLMQPEVTERSAALIEILDYVGISFYPYLGPFYSAIGGIDLAGPPDQWQVPFAWLRENIDKPLALCETGYASKPVTLSEFDLEIPGDPTVQSQYVADLAAITDADDYLFTVFFLAVDYDALTRKLGLPAMELWQHTGFFEADLTPKPAWETYRQTWLGEV